MEATGPFFGLENLQKFGGGVTRRRTRRGAAGERQYLFEPPYDDDINIGFAIKKVISGHIASLENGESSASDRLEEVVVLSSEAKTSSLPVDELPDDIKAALRSHGL